MSAWQFANRPSKFTDDHLTCKRRRTVFLHTLYCKFLPADIYRHVCLMSIRYNKGLFHVKCDFVITRFECIRKPSVEHVNAHRSPLCFASAESWFLFGFVSIAAFVECKSCHPAHMFSWRDERLDISFAFLCESICQCGDLHQTCHSWCSWWWLWIFFTHFLPDLLCLTSSSAYIY